MLHPTPPPGLSLRRPIFCCFRHPLRIGAGVLFYKVYGATSAFVSAWRALWTTEMAEVK